MEVSVSMDINTFSIPPTQYEVQNWLFGYGHIVNKNLGDGGGGSGIGGREGGEQIEGEQIGGSGGLCVDTGSSGLVKQSWNSLPFGWPVFKERGERVKSSKSFRRNIMQGHRYSWVQQESGGEHRLEDELYKDIGLVDKEWIEQTEQIAARLGRSLSLSRRHKHTPHRLDVSLRVLKGKGDNRDSIGSCDTLVGSSSHSLSSPSPSSPTGKRFSLGSFSKRTSTSHSLRPSPFPPSNHFPSTTIVKHPTKTTTTTTTTIPPPSSASFDLLSCNNATMDGPSKTPKAFRGLKASQPPATPTRSRQNRQHGLQYQAQESSSVNRFRPYGSVSQDGRYQNGEYYHGEYDRPQQVESQPLQHDELGQREPNQYSSPGSLGQLSRQASSQQLTQEVLGVNYEEEDESDPTWLGSVDYHNFLCGTSNRKTKLTPSPTITSQTRAANRQQLNEAGVYSNDFSAPTTAIKVKSSRESLIPAPNYRSPLHKLRPKQSITLRARKSQVLAQQSARTESPRIASPAYVPQTPTLKPKQSRTLRERTSQALIERFTAAGSSQIKSSAYEPPARTLKLKRSLFLRNRTQESLTEKGFKISEGKSDPLTEKLIGAKKTKETPRQPNAKALKESLTAPDTTKVPAYITTPIPATRTASSNCWTSNPRYPSLGSVESISWKHIDPDKLQPFIGPLPPQRPLPSRPLPPPPSLSKQRYAQNPPRFIMASNSTQGEVEESKDSSLPLPVESPTEPTENMEQRSFSASSVASTARDTRDNTSKNKRPSLRNKVSKLFGEERTHRASDNSASSASISAYRPISLTSHDSDGVSLSEIFDEVYNAARGSFSSVRGSHASTGTSVAPGAASTVVAQEPASVSSNAAGPSTSAVSQEVPSTLSTGNSHKSGSTSHTPVCPPMTALPHKAGSVRQSDKKNGSRGASMARKDIADRMASRFGVTDPVKRAKILSALTTIAPPPLHEHPAIRGDLSLQVNLGLLNNNITAAPVPATSAQNTSQSVAPVPRGPSGWTNRNLTRVAGVPGSKDMTKDIDPDPTFDRTVDITWYRHSKRVGETDRTGYLPVPSTMYSHVLTLFTAKYARGNENWAKYDNPKYKHRFRYFDLKPSIRFKIMEKLLEDYLPGKPILLNGKRQAAPAWPANEFATLWDVLGPLQPYLSACPRLRAEIMVTLFMTQPFHVIFSPFVKPNTQPLPTKWLFNYLSYMQDVRVELDMTKLGFGPTWEATTMSTKLQDIGNLVWVFVDEMLKRNPDANGMGQLTIHCRRYFGYRQGINHLEGNKEAYKFPLIGGHKEDKDPGITEGLPWNHGCQSASIPPSTSNPYSGHRRHHTYGSTRVPFVHENHMSVANPFLKLAGRVWSVRMVGLSENWVRDNYTKFWPKKEFDAIPGNDLSLYIDRYLPTRHMYVAHGHAIYVDYGLHHGIHRFPPLSDSDKMVCTYDRLNDVFTEVGSGNVLTMMEDGVEVVARAMNPPIPRSDLPVLGGVAIPLDSMDPIVYHSKIHTPVPGTSSSAKQAIQKGTPAKIAQILGHPVGDDSPATPSESPGAEDEDDELLTPTKSRVASNETVLHQRQVSLNDDEHPDEMESQRNRSTSANTQRAHGMSTKKSFLGLLGRDDKKPTK